VFVPGEVALLLPGSLLIHSIPAFVRAAVLFGALDFTATTALHLLARAGGNRALRWLLRRYRGDDGGPARFLDAWRGRIGARDAAVIFAMRFVPVVRMYASLISGLLRVRLGQFLIGAGPAAFIWASIPLATGYVLRSQVTDIERNFGTVTMVLTAVLVLVGLGFGFRQYLQRRATPTTLG
jgi:membrane protein DedA with SNARE-associated domain